MKAIDRRTILRAEDCPEGDPKRQAGEAGLTKTRSGYRPKGSTLDAEAPPEIDIAVTWEPSTENRCQQLTNGAEDSKDFRHQNKAEAEYNYGESPSGTEKNRGVKGESTPINRRQ
ncbi:hypothetical protein F2Q69_00033299 [Brassica cretica]|uniref:Uncharacterized protein n=1 Tax=Brassica cretica TaxID=69181 RepID=A0A8S9SAT0_BRACR|nr:hypothetical protein F2Q69_00033299 [Brassica cretica]